MLGGHVHKYEAVLWTLEKLKKKNNFFVAKSRINFSLWELEFSGNMYFSYTERLASSKVEKVLTEK